MSLFCFGSQIALRLVSLFYFSLIWQIWMFVKHSYNCSWLAVICMDLWVSGAGQKVAMFCPPQWKYALSHWLSLPAGLGVKRPWCTCRSSPAAGTGERFVVESALTSIIELQVAPFPSALHFLLTRFSLCRYLDILPSFMTVRFLLEWAHSQTGPK